MCRLAILTLVLFIGAAVCQQQPPTYNNHFCEASNDSTTAYRSGLRSLLNALVTESATVTFYKDTISAIQGYFLCRGDVSSQECRSCVETASRSLPDRCPANKGAVIWYDQCMLRYSNNSFFGSVQTSPSILMRNTQSGNFSSDLPNFGGSGFVIDLIESARSTEMLFSTAARSGRFGLAQCSRDLGRTECFSCLNQSSVAARSCCQNAAGWRVLNPSCFLRLEEYRFFELPPSPEPEPAISDGESGKKKILVIVVPLVAAAVASVILGFCCYIFCFRKKTQPGEGRSGEILLGKFQGSNNPPWMDATDEDENTEMKHFSLESVKTATNNFSSSNKLGEGGFGPVYKGMLPGGKEVAVKRLSMVSKQGVEEFRNEVKLIIKLQHKNLVRLLGYCLEGNEKLLVYEYMANTSLDSYLFDPTKCKVLDWKKRANIVKGTARGLQYLHEDSRLKIIHRDMKASNVLLDDEMNPKISDFGTARIFGGNQFEANTERVVGTYGYMAPEYALEGSFSVKSDVYSFGVLLLEIICGKRNRGSYNLDGNQSLLTYVWMLWNEDKGLELIDPNIVDDCSLHEALRWVHVALLCVQDDPALRPTMSSVALMLESASVNLPVPTTPPYSAAKFVTMSDQSSTSGTRSDFLASDMSTTGASST